MAMVTGMEANLAKAVGTMVALDLHLEVLQVQANLSANPTSSQEQLNSDMEECMRTVILRAKREFPVVFSDERLQPYYVAALEGRLEEIGYLADPAKERRKNLGEPR